MAEQPQQQMSEEQVKALQEKIKQMSPEELKEFQKKQCIFCQIISGKVQSKKVYEDEHVVAVLDINPANPGHMLIMPKEHYSIMPQIPDEEIGHLFLTAKALSNASLRALEVQGSNILVANGVAAGQKAQHFMLHLIPRKEGDGVDFEVPQKTIPENELQETAKLLADGLGTKATKPQKIPALPIIPKENKVVEAEFEDKSIIKKPIIKKPIKNKEKKPKETLDQKASIQNKETNSQDSKEKLEQKTKPKKETNGVDLDDIARILGAK